MSGFLSKIGKGLLYLLVLPIFIVVISIVAIIGLGGFVFLFFKQIVLFFTGRSLYADLPEDIQVKAILESQTNPSLNQQPQQQPSIQKESSPIQNSQLQQQPQVQVQTQQNNNGQPIINVHISSDAFMGGSKPFIVEPEPTRTIEQEPKQEEQFSIKTEPEIVLPDPAPEITQETHVQEQPTKKAEEKIGIYKSDDPVFSRIDDDDIL